MRHLFLVCLLLLTTLALPALAAYGEGSSTKRLYGLLFGWGAVVVVPPLILVWLGMRALIRAKKRRDAEALMEKLAAEDQVWDPKAFEARARQVFMAVAPVVTPEALEAVKAMFTPGGAAAWAEDLAGHQQAGKQRLFKLQNMIGVEMLRVDDRLEDDEDRAWALVRFYGYEGLKDVSEPSESMIQCTEQQQIWKFRRAGDDWLLESVEATTANAVLLTPSSTREKS